MTNIKFNHFMNKAFSRMVSPSGQRPHNTELYDNILTLIDELLLNYCLTKRPNQSITNN